MEQLDRILEIVGIGISQDLDNDEKIMIIGMELKGKEDKIKNALKQLDR